MHCSIQSLVGSVLGATIVKHPVNVLVECLVKFLDICRFLFVLLCPMDEISCRIVVSFVRVSCNCRSMQSR